MTNRYQPEKPGHFLRIPDQAKSIHGPSAQVRRPFRRVRLAELQQA